MRLPHPILSQEWLPSGPPPRQAPCQTAWWHPGTWLPPGGSQLPPAHCAALGRPPGHSAPRFLLRETGPAGVCRGLSRAETCVQLVVSPTEVSLTLGCCPSQGRCCGGGTVGAPARWRAGLRDVGSRQPGRGRRSVLSTRRWPRAACSRLVPLLLLPRRLQGRLAPQPPLSGNRRPQKPQAGVWWVQRCGLSHTLGCKLGGRRPEASPAGLAARQKRSGGPEAQERLCSWLRCRLRTHVPEARPLVVSAGMPGQ